MGWIWTAWRFIKRFWRWIVMAASFIASAVGLISRNGGDATKSDEPFDFDKELDLRDEDRQLQREIEEGKSERERIKGDIQEREKRIRDLTDQLSRGMEDEDEQVDREELRKRLNKRYKK